MMAQEQSAVEKDRVGPDIVDAVGDEGEATDNLQAHSGRLQQSHGAALVETIESAICVDG